MVPRQWLAEQAPPPVLDRVALENPVTAELTEQVPLTDTPSLVAGPLRSRVLDAVTVVAAPYRLAVSQVPADPWQLSMHLVDAQGTVLGLFIERVRGDGRYYKHGGGLGLWYNWEKRPDGGDPAWLVPVLEAVAELLLSPAVAGISDALPVRRPSLSVVRGLLSPVEHIEAVGAAGTLPSVPVRVPPDAREAVPPPDPKRPYARLRVLGAEDVERFFHVDYEFDAGADVDQPPTARIGIIYQCNQPCTFCVLAEMNTHIPPARVYGALDASRARGARRVILTGGEPTLCRNLLDYVCYARQQGFTTIELQTNATILDDRELAVRLRQAGLTDAQVSLHGPDGEISDRLTGAPGTHRRTLAGITNLLDAGVNVLLNHLVFRDNCHLLLEFVEMVERRWGRYREHLILQFHSPLNEFARLEHARKHIARYSEYASQLRRAIDRALELGYAVKDLQDPTGIPALCVLGTGSDYLGPIVSRARNGKSGFLSAGADYVGVVLPQRVKPRSHRWESEWMMRVEACRSCDIADACMGVPRGYVELYGEDEFRPVRLTPTS